MRYKVNLSLDLLEILLGLNEGSFKIMEISVQEHENSNPTLNLEISRQPIDRNPKVIEIEDFPIHNFGCGHSVPCWGAVEAIGNAKDED